MRKHFLQEYLEILDYFVHKLYRISSFSESEYFHILKSLSKNKYLQVNSILAWELLTPYVCGQSCHFGVFIGLNEIVVFFFIDFCSQVFSFVDNIGRSR